MCDLNLSDVGIEEGDGMIGIFWTKSFIKNVDCGLFISMIDYSKNVMGDFLEVI